MKILILLTTLISTAALAAPIESAQISTPSTILGTPIFKSNFTEAGMQVSSLNNGSAYATVGLMHEFDNGFTGGIRGFVPMQYTKQTQSFIGQAVGRFMLMYDVNQMFIEGTLSQGVFNSPEGDTALFAMAGASYGYMRKLTEDIRIGANIGVDYTRQRISDDTMAMNTGILYNHFSLNGSFYF